MELSEINPYPRTVGYFPEWNYENLSASIAYDLRIFAVLRSTALLTLNEKTFRMPADSLLVLAPGEPYDFRNEDPAQPFDLYCLSFDLTQEYRSSPRYRLPTYLPLFQPEFLIDQKIRSGTRDISNLSLPLILNHCPEICAQVRQIHQLFCDKPIYYLERCSGIIKEILFTILPEHAELEAEKKASDGVATARRTMQYIEEHFREPINEQSIAAALNFHPYYLARLTMRYFSVTPYQYLLQCRIEEAIRQLLHTNHGIGEIAASCGFTSPSHFSSVI
ncbi:MAG: helix-turn-helix transcriptional regulator, partial [Eubacteriales bacterium]